MDDNFIVCQLLPRISQLLASSGVLSLVEAVKSLKFPILYKLRAALRKLAGFSSAVQSNGSLLPRGVEDWTLNKPLKAFLVPTNLHRIGLRDGKRRPDFCVTQY